MPRLPSFKVKNTPKGWRLNIPATISDTGTQQRLYFPTRDAAQTEATRRRDDYKANGEKASVLPPRVAGDAAAAWTILEPWGISLVEAARFQVAHLEQKAKSVKIDELVSKFRESKKTISDSQAKGYRLTGAALCEYFPDRIVSTITHGELLDFLDYRTSAPASYNLAIRLVGAIWRWGAKQPREWCQEKTVKGIEPQPTHSGEIGILTAEQAENLLRIAENRFPDCVAPLAIALYAGARQEEIVRMVPGDVVADGITVPNLSAKTKRRRFVQMTEPLEAWLTAYPVTDFVCPPNWPRKYRAIRRRAGWRVWTEDVDPNAAPKDLPLWPHNALRHTAATGALSLGKDLSVLIFEHGHSGGVEVLKGHYIGRMSKREAAAIAALRPEGRLVAQ